MRRGARPGKLGGVHPDEPESLRVVIDLDPGPGAPSGRVTDERGVRARFSGWLELMDRVEGVLRRAGEGEPQPIRGDARAHDR